MRRNLKMGAHTSPNLLTSDTVIRAGTRAAAKIYCLIASGFLYVVPHMFFPYHTCTCWVHMAYLFIVVRFHAKHPTPASLHHLETAGCRSTDVSLTLIEEGGVRDAFTTAASLNESMRVESVVELCFRFFYFSPAASQVPDCSPCYPAGLPVNTETSY